jgi:hypothetical protein
MTGAAWLPLILYAVIQTTRQRSWLIAMLAGIPLALQILTAQPQIVFYTLVIIIGYGIYRVGVDLFFVDGYTKASLRYAGHTVLLLTATIIAGLLLAAPQLLPTVELQQLSIRAQERGWSFLTKNSLPPAMWLNLLLPSAFGNNVVGFEGGDPFQEDFIYISIIPLFLVFWSWGQRWQRDMAFFWFLLVGGVLMAMGRYTPLYATIIQYLPVFDLFRIPSRWLMAVNLALAVLAGFGLETLLQRGLSRRAWVILAGISLGLLAILSLIWIFKPDLSTWTDTVADTYQRKLMGAFLIKGFTFDSVYQNRLWPPWLISLSIPAVLLAVNIILVVVSFTLYAAHRITARAFAVLVIGAISFDLVVAGGTTINPTKPAAWWQQLSGGAKYVLENVGTARVFPLGMGSEDATVSHLGQYFPSVYRVRSAGGHGSSLMMARYSTFLHEVDPVQGIRVLGVRYLLTEGQMGADTASTYPLAYHDDVSYVYENNNPLPRTFIVHQAVQVDSPDEGLVYFQSRSIDPAQTVILETDTPAPALAVQGPTQSSTATIINEHPQLVEIEADLATDGYLVLLDTYYPGWKATVDGRVNPIYRANYVGRAVFVPAGKHIVRFTYQPASFRVGVWLSLLVVVTLTILAFRGNLPGRRPNHD